VILTRWSGGRRTPSRPAGSGPASRAPAVASEVKPHGLFPGSGRWDLLGYPTGLAKGVPAKSRRCGRARDRSGVFTVDRT
jgi:hypothetical protein